MRRSLISVQKQRAHLLPEIEPGAPWWLLQQDEKRELELDKVPLLLVARLVGQSGTT
jgi:hypothetical protein